MEERTPSLQKLWCSLKTAIYSLFPQQIRLVTIQLQQMIPNIKLILKYKRSEPLSEETA